MFISLDPGSNRDENGRQLMGLRGIGPWTASYVAMRALGDPDAFLPQDLGVKQAIQRLGYEGDREGCGRPRRAVETLARLRHAASVGEPRSP